MDEYKGRVSDILDEIYKKAYDKGLTEAWECAKEIMQMSSVHLSNVFGYVTEGTVMERLTPLEAKAKMEDYEEKHGERPHWINKQDGRWIYAECSECHTVHDVKSKYCPDCGCFMGDTNE